MFIMFDNKTNRPVDVSLIRYQIKANDSHSEVNMMYIHIVPYYSKGPYDSSVCLISSGSSAHYSYQAARQVLSQKGNAVSRLLLIYLDNLFLKTEQNDVLVLNNI